MGKTLAWLIAVALLIPLVVRTRGAILALLPIALPWLLPLLRDWLRSRPVSSGDAPGKPGQQRRSRIDTAYLHLELDHDSGELRGTVIAGDYRGRDLASLERRELLSLWRECASDPQSQAALETFLERIWPDWAQAAGDQSRHRPPGAGEALDEDEAYAILGLRPGADADAIVAAHRRLMQKVHPDHGGSDYLAERINAAKHRLLSNRR